MSIGDWDEGTLRRFVEDTITGDPGLKATRAEPRLAKFQANGAAFGASFADTGVLAEPVMCGGSVRLRGTIRAGGNTAGALLHTQVFADGVGTGVVGTVMAQGAGIYLTCAIDGWVALNPGVHTFTVWAAVSAGIGNLDAGTPSFLAIGGR